MNLAGLSLPELLGFLTGVVNVWLLARQNIWNWPVGIANTLIYFAVFLRSGLYGDAGLQLVFTTLNAYGWWRWLHPGARYQKLPVTRTGRRASAWLASVIALTAIGLFEFLSRFTDSTVSGWDAITTALSLGAIYGQTRKWVESWWLWILVDLMYIPLYIYKALWLTALLYVVFLVLSIIGLKAWTKALSATVDVSPVTAGRAR
jgi:nicotinamide mononucleotide transporter